MKLTIILIVVAVLILRVVVAMFFRRGEDNSEEVTLSERVANLSEKWFHWHERTVEEATVGWRHDEGQQERVNGNGVTEYYRVVRKGKK